MITIDASGVEYGPAHAFGLSPEDVTGFYRANWTRPISLELPRFYRWQFIEAPESGALDWNCVAVRGSTILGVMGLNPRPFILAGRRLRGAELTTWVVGKSARGLGVGRGIIRSIQAAWDVAFGFGISEAALPIYLTQGFRRQRHIPRYFRILDLDAVRPHARITTLGERLAAAKPTQPRLGIGLRRVPAAELAKLGLGMADTHNLYLRDGTHLSWRYDDHPTYRYEAYEVTGEATGARLGVVVRHDCAVGMRFTHVLDVLGSDRDVPLLHACLDRIATEAGSAFIDFYCTATDITRHLLADGWFSTNDDEWFQLSHLFYPPEFRDTQTTSMVYWSGTAMADLADLGRLYLTKEDLDLDRPTLIYYEAHGLAKQ
ncbi:hypothetical protein [Methylorubrum extorquens]|uniref:Uncharacterized protein n=1 Tax=Methylorubrum extorquens (strain CM4 / NCIMB 13688) TaxID=440085 RepID=B7KYN7_METC4|nr:hypothetical protein [Methylorubrum extorquens]ACK84788.1 hypothetical protein Mchl_3983 [Methylorubrum extorquens CM4]